MTDAVPAAPGLYAKLAMVTDEIGRVEARGFHDFYKTKYVTEGDLVDAVREHLAAHKVVMLPSVTGIDERASKTSKGKETTITTVRMSFVFCDGESGQTHTCEWAGSGEDDGDKGLSKAYTGALRYFLLKAFLVPVGAESVSEPRPQPPRADGQHPINREQIDGIVDMWKRAGSDERALHDILDTQGVKNVIEGQDLSLSQRVQLLSALEAIAVLKKLQVLAEKLEAKAVAR